MGSDGIYQLMHTVLSFQRLVGLAVVGLVHRILDVCCVLLANLQKKKELLLSTTTNFFQQHNQSVRFLSLTVEIGMSEEPQNS